MFGFARTIVRNKFVFLGLALVIGFLFFGQKKDEDAGKPANPWSNAPAKVEQVAASNVDKDSFTDKAISMADSAAKAAGAEEFSPSALREKSIGNIDKASSAVNNANSE